jgi:acyl carrier protein
LFAFFLTPFIWAVYNVRHIFTFLQKEDACRAMDQPQIYSRLAEIFRNLFDEDSLQLTPGLSAKDIDGWDSLTHIRLILTIEKAFKVKFSTAEIGKLENVGDLVSLIESRA